MRNLLNAESIASSRIFPETPWRERIERAAGAVFAKLPSRRIAAVSSRAARYGDLTAVIGLSGAIFGSLSVRCSWAAAGNFARGMLGVPEPTKEQIQITLGELAHRIARTMGKEAAGPARECLIEAPIVFGHASADGDPLAKSCLVAFEFQGFPVWIRFSIYD